jgi:hypothetical protein
MVESNRPTARREVPRSPNASARPYTSCSDGPTLGTRQHSGTVKRESTKFRVATTLLTTDVPQFKSIGRACLITTLLSDFSQGLMEIFPAPRLIRVQRPDQSLPSCYSRLPSPFRNQCGTSSRSPPSHHQLTDTPIGGGRKDSSYTARFACSLHPPLSQYVCALSTNHCSRYRWRAV